MRNVFCKRKSRQEFTSYLDFFLPCALPIYLLGWEEFGCRYLVIPAEIREVLNLKAYYLKFRFFISLFLL